MRGCLSVLVLGAAFALGAAWFGSPAVAAFAVESALDASGFEASSRTVRVVSDPPIEILTGHADRVEIEADEAQLDQLNARTVDLSLVDVDLTGRRFESVDGSLDRVVVRSEDGRLVDIERIEVNGPAADADAVAFITGDVVERLAEGAVADAVGLPIADVGLSAPDLLTFAVGGNRVEGRLVVDPDGALALAVDLPGAPRVQLIAADPLRLESVTVDDDRLILTGTVDLTTLVG